MLRQFAPDFHILIAVYISELRLPFVCFPDNISTFVTTVLAFIDIFAMPAHAFVPPTLVFVPLSHFKKGADLTAL